MIITTISKQEFIEKVAAAVKKYAPKYGILVYSPIIAQACLESAFGTSPKAALHNNILGLKYRAGRVTCNNGTFTDGGSEQNPDGSYTILPGNTVWYSFDSIEKCVEGYFQFINISNYKALKGETDPYEYLKKIKAAGYATSLNYVDNVYKRIKDYDLTKYDPVKKKFKVAIDAGHGSNTAGKRHPDGYREHYSNVYISYYLDQILTKNGLDTVKISWNDDNAKDDADVALTTRQSQVKASGADILISTHANAFGSGAEYNNAEGVETLYHSEDSKVGDSKRLAELVQKEMIKGTVQVNRGIKRQTLAMCNCPAMGVKAAVLVETGFMTNKRESELLRTDLFWRECAREMAQGIFNYLGVVGNVAVPLTSIVGTVDPDDGDKNNPPKQDSNPSTVVKAGQEFKLTKVPFYNSSTAKTKSSTKSGTFWVWSADVVNGRVRMTNAKSRVGISGMITGWVDESVLKNILNPPTTNNSNNTNPVVTVSGGKYIYEGLDYSPIFDPVFYCNTHVDIKKYVGTDKKKLFEHFVKYGMKEGRRPCDSFDVNAYKNRYADLRAAFKNNLPDYYKHFLKYGIKEGRSGRS